MTLTSYLRVSAVAMAVVAAALLCVVLMWHTKPASAQSLSTEAAPGTTIMVNSKGDATKSGNCTLREAIEAANTNSGVDKCKAGSDTYRDAIPEMLSTSL